MECRQAISQILAGESIITDDMVLAFLKALDELSFPGWVDNRYGEMSDINDEQNCKNIASYIANVLSCAVNGVRQSIWWQRQGSILDID